METALGPLDWLVVAADFVLVAGIGLWATRRQRQGGETSEGYFLGGRSVGWVLVGASLFASNIGSEHLVGLAGTGAASGMAVGQFEILAALMLLLLGWVFVPFYIRSGVYTMPEFLERRYSPAARWYLAVVSIIAYVLTKISVTVFAGAVVVTALTGIDFWTAAVVVVVVTGIYTVFGGLLAVVYADALQVAVLIAGALAVTLIGLDRIGGVEGLVAGAGPGYFDMWKPMTHPDFPWTGILFGAPILGIWYWCTDQFIVQRTLAARSVGDARRGAIFAGFLKILPAFIFVVPGIVAYVLAQRGLLTFPQVADPVTGQLVNDYNGALPLLVREMLPVGVRGLVVAGLLAALMSSLAAVFNSCATLITMDVYGKLRPGASDRRLVWVGRASTVLLTVLGLAWIPFMRYFSGQLYTYLQSIQAYISPPIAAVFLFGLFWSRINAQGAMASLVSGFVLGMGRIVAELNKASLAEGSLLFLFADANFLHFAIFLFAVCTVILVVVSLVTPAPNRAQIAGLTYATADDPMTAPEPDPVAADRPTAERAAAALHVGGPVAVTSDLRWRRADVILSVVLAACVGLVWIIFS